MIGNMSAIQFHAEPFLVALKKLQDRQYGRKMQTYQPPPENMFEKLPLSDPLNEETLLRTIHSQWVNLHAVTRDNLLKFETPGFKLHREAHGDMNVKILVSSVSAIQLYVRLDAIPARSSERYRPIMPTIRSRV